jgi:outer membrane protein assembly factor BamB
MHSRRLLAFGFLLAAASLVFAKDTPPRWAQWRGPSGQGFSDDKRVPLEWSEAKNVVWKAKLPGVGNSSPIVWGDRVFLTAARGDERVVFCVDSATGKILWEKVAVSDDSKEGSHAWNGYASPSCTTDGKHVWAFFGTPGLFCYDIDGKLVWQRAFGKITSKLHWGAGASPFLYEDTVIMNCDNDGGAGAAPAALVALDKLTGKPRWSTPRDQGRGFSTPRLMKSAKGRIDLVLNGPNGLWSYDPKTGKERWHVGRSAPKELGKFGEPMPVDDGQRIFVASGRTGPYQVLKMPGLGDLTTTHVLHTGTRGHRDVASPIVWEGKVYCVDMKAHLNCYSLATGKEVYGGRIGKREGSRSLASPIAVRGKLLWVLDDGTTIVLQPGDEPKVVGRNKLDGATGDYGASPAVADGKLYIRSQTHLYCIGEKTSRKR